MDPKRITCELCGGNEFNEEAGFYYCKECQTQTQDLQEHVVGYATAPVDISVAQAKKARRKVKKAENQVTSWECFNYVMLGLVNELIELGADKSLKATVNVLWLKYLRHLEVISDTPDAPPKLSAVYPKRDAEIIYGHTQKRRRKSRSTSPSTTTDISTIDPSLLRKEFGKRKRAMVKANYNKFISSQKPENVSLLNQSLTTLQSGSETSKNNENVLQYNKIAKKELKKKIKMSHLKLHCRDVTSSLECHKMTYDKISTKYSLSLNILSQKKLYAILYLGLLINKDAMQLGDMLRFIREGHLSFGNVTHFYPEEIKYKSQARRGNNLVLTHKGVRKMTAKLAVDLKVTKYILVQNLIELCERYCTELNLPSEVFTYATNLIGQSLPRMEVTRSCKIIPNYEGRAIAMIMFVMKLLFGLDDETEYKFSEYATRVNTIRKESRDDEPSMFIWNDWITFIQLRKLAISQYHFPSQYLYASQNVANVEPFVQFMVKDHAKQDTQETVLNELQVLKVILEKLQSKEDPVPNPLTFSPSLTPFRDYANVLLQSSVLEDYPLAMKTLQQNFDDKSLRFLTKSFAYLKLINETDKVGMKHRGANNRIKFIPVRHRKTELGHRSRDMNTTTLVKIVSQAKEVRMPATADENKFKHSERCTKHFLVNYEKHHMRSFRRNMKQMASLCKENDFSHDKSDDESQKNDNRSQSDDTSNPSCSHSRKPPTRHYIPQERYWIKMEKSLFFLNKEEFQQYMQSFPYSFQLLLRECSRITEQAEKVLLDEFTNVELYLSYVEFQSKKQEKTYSADNALVSMIKNSIKDW